jgi:uncharacterized membrane protein
VVDEDEAGVHEGVESAAEEDTFGLSDTHRAEAFSDGVFSIVATLLVLDVIPPLGKPGQLLPELLARWPTYLAYLASFLYVGVNWLNHKAVFAHLRRMDRPLHWYNLGILATVALLPFPTAVIADAIQTGNAADIRTAIGLYGLIGALVCASWLIFFHGLHRRPRLLTDEVKDGFYGLERARALAGVVLYALAAAVGALATPLGALIIFIALPVFYGVTSHGLAVLPGPLRWISPGR